MKYLRSAFRVVLISAVTAAVCFAMTPAEAGNQELAESLFRSPENQELVNEEISRKQELKLQREELEFQILSLETVIGLIDRRDKDILEELEYQILRLQLDLSDIIIDENAIVLDKYCTYYGIDC